jgi:23S rRNA G2445 N2-methylase RlmL
VQATASRIFHEGRLTEQIEALLPPGSEEFGLIDVRLMDNRLRLAVSLGGEPLYRRRFKPDLMGKASIKEDLAATLTRHALTFAGPLFRPDVVLVPFAGSGTLGYEAILAASQVPPCALAGGRAIERMPCVPAATLAFARKALAARERHALTVHYIEADPEQTAALERGTATFDAALQSNGINAPTHVITTGDATKPWPVTTGAIFVPVNPPYGHRLADKRAAMALYEATVRQLDGLAGRPAAGFVLGLGDDTRRVVEKGLQRWRTELRAIRHGGLPVWALFFASR